MILRAPLALAAAAMAGGIWTGRLLPLTAGAWAVLGGLAVLTVALTLRREHLLIVTSAAIALGIFAAAAASIVLGDGFLADNHIVRFSDRSGVLASLRGQVVSSPQIIQQHTGYYRPPATTFLLECGQILDSQGQWRSVSGLARIRVDEPLRDLRAGQEVELVGTLRRPRGPDNPGQFDWRKPQRDEDLLVAFDLPGADGLSVRGGGGWLSQNLWYVRSLALQHVEGAQDEQASYLLGALLIGERHPALRQLNQSMQRSGTVHYLSISGSHLAIFLGFVYLLCRLLAQSRRRAAGIVLVVLVIYLLLAKPEPPLLRSAIMAACVAVAVLVGRRYLALNAISTAAVILLAVEPRAIFSAGFQLSFGIVLGMILLYRPVRQGLFGRYLRQRGLMVFRRRQRLRRWLHYKAGDWLVSSVTLSLIAYLVSAPLAAYHFGLFSPYALLLSPLLLLPVTAVLVPGFISMALAWPMPHLADGFNDLAAWSADGLTWCVWQFERLPCLCLELRPLSIGWVALCYAALLAGIFHRRIPRGRWLAGAAVLALAGLTVWHQLPEKPPREMEINLLAVGEGQCALVRTPSGKCLLIDAGSQQLGDGAESILQPFLRERRLPWPEMVVLSHPNADHFNFVPYILQHGRLRQAYLGAAFDAPDPAEAAGIARFRQQLADQTELSTLHAGQQVQIDPDTRLEVIWPPEGYPTGKNVNDSSLVLKLTCRGHSAIFTGDIDTAAQTELARNPQALACDVLVLPHHGHWRESLPAFVAACSPKLMLASTARNLRLNDAPTEEQAFYAQWQARSRFLSTASNGWILVTLTPAGPATNIMR